MKLGPTGFERSPIVLVTANLGGIDSAYPLPAHDGVDAVYFSDFAPPPSVAGTWDTVVTVTRPPSGMARLVAKFPKCQIQRLNETAGYRYFAWADACYRFSSLEFLQQLAGTIGESQTLASFIPHPDRSTVSEEYDFVIDQIARGNRYLRSRYDGESLKRERDALAERHDLNQLRLWAGGLWLLPNGPIVSQFLDAWWAAINANSIFDQCQLSASLADAGIEVEPFRVSYRKSAMFTRIAHA